MTQWKWETEGSEVVETFKDRVEGKTIIVTGPSPGGIGAQTAIDLAAGKPALLLLAGRTLSKIQPLIDTIKSSHPSVPVEFIQVDLASQASVHEAAATINKKIEKLDILINNAAIMACPYAKTEDGVESQFATNHLGHFLLTALLKDKILAAAPGARIVNVSSSAHRGGFIRFNDYNFSDGKAYTPFEGYGQSKMANVLFAESLAEKFGSRGVFAYSLNPGSIKSNLQVWLTPEVLADAIGKATEYMAKRGKTFKREHPKTYEQGCSTTLIAALDPEIEEANGKYLNAGQLEESTVKENFENPEETRRKLWELSERLVGEKFEV